MKMKVCAKCNIPKPTRDFYWVRATKRTDKINAVRPRSRHSYCKTCVKINQQAYANSHRDSVRRRNRKSTAAWRRKNPAIAKQLIKNWHKKHPEAKKQYQVHRYHLTWDAFVAMLVAQNYRCLVCHQPILKRTQQMIDHDHSCCNAVNRSCGKCVRGILCTRCNHVLGMVDDNVDLLLALVGYLRGFSEKLLGG